MQGYKITLCIHAALLSASFGCQIFAQSGGAKPGTATVSGRVTLKSEPARNVLVYLRPQRSTSFSNQEDLPRAWTDDVGRFRIAGVAAGAYTVIALAPGFITSDLTGIGLGGKTLNVPEGENVESAEIELKQGGVISGRVTDSGWRPLADERVMLNKLEKNGRPQQNAYYGPNFEMYQTDDRGVYRIYGLPEGRYLVSVGIQRSGGIGGLGAAFYPRTFHPDAANETEARAIEVTEGSENTDIDITVPEAIQTRAISGRVVNAETGQPVAGVEITWTSISEDGRYYGYGGFQGARSREKGEFHLRGLTPGKCAVLPRASSDNEFISEPVVRDLSEGDASGVEIRVRLGGSVSGFVVIEGTNDPKPLAKLPQQFLYFSVNQNELRFPRTDNPKINADGSFLVRGLPPGTVNIQYSRRPDDRGLALARIEHNGAVVRDGIKVGAGERVTGALVVLTYKTFALRGEVKMTGDPAPASQRIYAHIQRTDQSLRNSSSQGAEVDARGQFIIEGLTPGEYEVTVRPVQYPGADPIDPRVARAFSSAKQTVNINGESQRVTFAVDLGRKEENR